MDGIMIALFFLLGLKLGPEGMVPIQAGTYVIGSHPAPYDPLEGPEHSVQIQEFWIDRTEVTNAQFSSFVKASGYITVTEKEPLPKDYPGAPMEALIAGSACFCAARPGKNELAGWEYRAGANWRHPNGPDSTIKGHDDDPVVQVTLADALAYAKWAGKDLPTEKEFEIASRGGLVGKMYSWGDVFQPSGRWMANIYQGEFPKADTGEDGFKGLAPVAKFPPNGYGLYDMTGNVWELTKTPGPQSEIGRETVFAKGGSYLCAANYCARYRPSAKIPVETDTATNHIGFRCVWRPR